MELRQIGIGHPAVKRVLDVRNNSAPNRHRLFVAEGLWASKVVLDSGIDVDTFFHCPEAVVSDEAKQRGEELAARAEHAFQVSPRTLARLAEMGNPDGLVSLARMPSWSAADVRLGRSALVLVADAIEIPGNLGTLIRTLDACKADCLILTNRRTRMSHPKVLRGSQGMSIRVPSLEFDHPADAAAWLKARHFDVYLADTGGPLSYRRADYRGRTAFVVGSERYGISKPWYDHGFERVHLPMLGYADSLNVSVSASILLYEARAQKSHW